MNKSIVGVHIHANTSATHRCIDLEQFWLLGKLSILPTNRDMSQIRVHCRLSEVHMEETTTTQRWE